MLPSYKKILVATDFSPNSDHAFKHAVLLARLHDAQIHLLHVVPQVDAAMRSYISSVMGEERLESFEKRNQEQSHDIIRKQLDAFAKAELQGSPEDQKHFAASIVELGTPVLKILEVADRIDADVIVVASHGKGTLEHAFLGSSTEKLLRKTTRPVFVVPLRG